MTGDGKEVFEAEKKAAFQASFEEVTQTVLWL